MLIKSILAFICCVPFWTGSICLCSTVRDRLCDLFEGISESHLYQVFVLPWIGLLISVIAPGFFLGLGLLVWSLAKLLFGLG